MTKPKKEQLTFLGIKEEEGFVEGKSVIIRRRRRRLMLWNGFDNDDRKCNHHGSYDKWPNTPFQNLAAAYYATQVHVLGILHIRRSQKPASLCIIQLLVLLMMINIKIRLLKMIQRSSVPVFARSVVPVMIIIFCIISSVVAQLKWASPVISCVHIFFLAKRPDDILRASENGLGIRSFNHACMVMIQGK